MARGNSLKTLDISSYISPQVVLTTAPQLLWARRRHCCISPSASPSDPHRHPATSRSPGKSRSRLLWNVGHGHYPKCSVWISVWPVANSAHRKSGSPLLRYSTSPFRTSPPPAPPCLGHHYGYGVAAGSVVRCRCCAGAARTRGAWRARRPRKLSALGERGGLIVNTAMERNTYEQAYCRPTHNKHARMLLSQNAQNSAVERFCSIFADRLTRNATH